MGLTFYNKDDREESQRGKEFKTGVMGNMWYREFEFQTVANSTPAYAAGGISLADSNVANSKFGLSSVSQVSIEPKGGFIFQYDIANDKIIMRSDGGGTAGAALAEEAAGPPAAVTYIKGMAWGTI